MDTGTGVVILGLWIYAGFCINGSNNVFAWCSFLLAFAVTVFGLSGIA